MGQLLPLPEAYFTSDVYLGTNISTSRLVAPVAGFAVRQHPVNLGLFGQGCSQCHRLAGPLTEGSAAPPDVFDRLGSPGTARPAPARFTRLTTTPGREEYPSWSPDGSSILYEARDAEGRYNLWLVNADGSGRRRLTDHDSAGWAVWHPDGGHIAYWAADSEARGNIWLLDIHRGDSTRLTNHRMTAWPRWSPDGRYLAYQARDSDTWSLRLWDVRTGQERDVTPPDAVMPSRPLWSPDGSQILYQDLVGTRFEMARLAFPWGADGEPDYAATPRRIPMTSAFPVDLGAAPQDPAWSPDSDRPRIAFVRYTLQVVPPSTMAFTYKTWVVSPDGSHPKQLVPDGTLADRSPTWNTDGTWLAQWSWNADLHAGVWLIDETATRQIDLTSGLGSDSLHPAWSPAGDKVAFASNREGSFDIWLADVGDLVGGGEGR